MLHIIILTITITIIMTVITINVVLGFWDSRSLYWSQLVFAPEVDEEILQRLWTVWPVTRGYWSFIIVIIVIIIIIIYKSFTLLDLCVSSLRRGHANLLCIVPVLTDDPRRESMRVLVLYNSSNNNDNNNNNNIIIIIMIIIMIIIITII